MWSSLPFDLLANIFCYLPPDSFARAKTVCRNWHASAANVSTFSRRHQAWFIAFPTHRGQLISCYVHNPVRDDWLVLPLDNLITSPIKPIATLHGIVLLKLTATLATFNPFTNQFRKLPMLNVIRKNPAVGVVECNNELGFKIYVAGGMSEGAMSEQTIEMYESFRDTWKIIGEMPVEFAVRLTVWTPNESVYSNGVLYWMTSARAYSVMGFEIRTKRWREWSVPLADRLEFATLVSRNGKLGLVGGVSGGDVCIWEFGVEDGIWCLVEKVPFDLVILLLGEKVNWSSIKCCGIEGAICLYRDFGSGVIVWREVLNEEKWEWVWIEGCCSIRGRITHHFPIKGLLLHPNLVNSL